MIRRLVRSTIRTNQAVDGLRAERSAGEPTSERARIDEEMSHGDGSRGATRFRPSSVVAGAPL